MASEEDAPLGAVQVARTQFLDLAGQASMALAGCRGRRRGAEMPNRPAVVSLEKASRRDVVRGVEVVVIFIVGMV